METENSKVFFAPFRISKKYVLAPREGRNEESAKVVRFISEDQGMEAFVGGEFNFLSRISSASQK